MALGRPQTKTGDRRCSGSLTIGSFDCSRGLLVQTEFEGDVCLRLPTTAGNSPRKSHAKAGGEGVRAVGRNAGEHVCTSRPLG
jgi:hypothetical protein